MGLTTWDQLPDNYDYSQLAGNWNIINFHDHTPGHGVQIPQGGIAPGAVGPLQLASGVPLITGGHSVITTGDTRSVATTYAPMANPDQVTNLVLGTTGIIRCWYYAKWQESVAGAARAAIFVGPTQLQVPVPGGSPANTECGTLATSTVNVNAVLATTNLGLGTTATQGVATTGADVTTGQVFGASTTPNVTVGGTAVTSNWQPCSFWAAPGTYTVSVQFKAISTPTSVTVSNRRLYVQVTPL